MIMIKDAEPILQRALDNIERRMQRTAFNISPENPRQLSLLGGMEDRF
jgi:hypothetical protein